MFRLAADEALLGLCMFAEDLFLACTKRVLEAGVGDRHQQRNVERFKSAACVVKPIRGNWGFPGLEKCGKDSTLQGQC